MQTPLMTDGAIALEEPPTSAEPRHEAKRDDAPISVSLLDVTDPDQVGELWTDLQVRSRHSFFTSWSWVGCWLAQLPVPSRPRLLIAENHSGVVGLALLGRKRLRRARIIGSNSWLLHETGDPVYDSLTIEHNGILAERDLESTVSMAMIRFLSRDCPDWDELYLSGIDSESHLATMVEGQFPGIRYRVVKQSPCYMVDLAGLRNSGKDFCSNLGSSTRANVRKSIRLYEERGALTLVAPRDVDEALCFYEEMKTLHRASWETRGESGAFIHPWVDGFHRMLISTRFPHGEIQLLQIQAGDQAIGYLYNFVCDGHVAFYQSGFRYEENPKFKPGLVCHTLAIEHNREQGAHTYDFLAGESQYKRSLGSAMQSLQWGILQRNRVRFRVEDGFRIARRCFRELLSGRPKPAEMVKAD